MLLWEFLPPRGREGDTAPHELAAISASMGVSFADMLEGQQERLCDVNEFYGDDDS